MAMGMGDHQLQAGPFMDRLPLIDDSLNDRPDRKSPTIRGRSRVHEQGSVRAEEKVEERGFEARALALAQDVGVLGERMHLKRRTGLQAAVGRAVNPLDVEAAVWHRSRA